MSDAPAELWDRLAAAGGLEPGETQLDETRAVMRHAEAAADLDLLAEARLALVDALYQAAASPDDMAELLTVYVRSVNLYIQAPEHFSERLVYNLWRGLGIVGTAIINLPDLPASQIRALLGDMESRCRPDRNDEYTIALLRMQLETRLGDPDATLREARRLRTLEPADYFDPSMAWLTMILCLVEMEWDEEAIGAVAIVNSGQVPTDGDQMPDLSDFVLLPLLRLGRLDEARDAHEQSWQDPMHGHQLAAHLEFCARTGNEERGREVLHRNLHQLSLQADTWLEMRELAAAALLCRRLCELGYGDEVWTWPADEDDPYDEDEQWTYAELHRATVDGATAFAERLDARNETAYQSTWVRRMVDAEPIVTSLPLSGTPESAQSGHRPSIAFADE